MSVYYFHSIELVALAANELGRKNDFTKYTDLKNRIYTALLNKYFTEEGKLTLNTQTSYVLCLQYKIYKNKDIIIQDFKERIKDDLYHIKTGFTGTPLILLALFDNGMDDFAYRLLYNEEFPGWLYPINLGATTFWERWNALLEDGSLGNYHMNLFNHYAYGLVCEAIYSRIVGLRNSSPGWKKVIIKPHLNYRMKSINFSYQSISGKYEVRWRWIDTRFNLNVTIPNGF
jgi:alpha-L-rhamnosidase